MIAYRYDSNGLYIGNIPCQLDPRATKEAGEDVYLIPANSTLTEPPQEKEGYNVVWNGGAWEYIENPKPPAPPEPTPEEIIEHKLTELDAQYNVEIIRLGNEYNTAQLRGDTDIQSALKEEMSSLDSWFDEEYEKIVGGDE